MEEDKDLEILQRICQCRRFSGVYTDIECIFEAIENLIARYKETKQELESVKEIYYTQKEIEENYIPKSKVKEKIEELDIRIGECCENIDKTVDEERAYWKKEKRDVIMQRFILQEMLED